MCRVVLHCISTKIRIPHQCYETALWTDKQASADVFEFYFVARSSKPNAEGHYWVVVLAADEKEAEEKARKRLPEVYGVRLLPFFQTNQLLLYINRDGLAWLGGLFFLLMLIAVGFYRDEDDNIQRTFVSAVGSGTLFVIGLMLSSLVVLSVLDEMRMRVLRRAPENEDIEKTVERTHKLFARIGCTTALVLVVGVTLLLGLLVFSGK